MSLESEEWRCSHGHTKKEHPVCYQTAKDQEKNKTLDTWVSCGKAQITSSGKMLRVTVDEEEHYFFFLRDFYDILAGHRQALTLFKIVKGSQKNPPKPSSEDCEKSAWISDLKTTYEGRVSNSDSS